MKRVHGFGGVVAAGLVLFAGQEALSQSIFSVDFFETTVDNFGADADALDAAIQVADGNTSNVAGLTNTVNLSTLTSDSIIGVIFTIFRGNGNNDPALEGVFFDITTNANVTAEQSSGNLASTFGLTYNSLDVYGRTVGPDGQAFTADDINVVGSDTTQAFDTLVVTPFVFNRTILESFNFEDDVEDVFSVEFEVRGGFGGVVIFGDGTGTLSVTSVPEPGSLALLALGLPMIASRRRR